jgi:protein TonB
MTLGAWLGFEANTSSGTLVPAVAVSVALHVAVLAGVPDFESFAEDAPRAPLNARLAPIDAPRATDAMPATAPLPEREQAREMAPPPRTERRASPPSPPPPSPRVEPAPAPALAPPPAPARQIAREDTAVTAPEAPTVSAAPLAALRPEPVSAAGEPSAMPRAAPDAIDSGSLGQYRLALLGTARRHKLYPDMARERGWEGRVAVELVIGADGVLTAAQVKHSSGHGVLDREALEMLKRAASLTPVPPSLRGREFRLDVPVLFELRNG